MSTADQLKPYKGSLTVAQIACGMNAAIENAARLAADARLLFEQGRWPTAASIAALSIEESGKVSILRRFVGAAEHDVKALWKEYRSHTSKNVAWIVPSLIERGARNLQDFKPIHDPSSDHGEVLDSVKQIGFYSDCLGIANWSKPSNVIDQRLAASLLNSAELLVKDRHVTEQELEAWERHVAPVINGPRDRANEGLIKWYEEMQRLGLAEAGQNEMQIFIAGGHSLDKGKE